MAILNVPRISGPSYGGVIYGLSLQMGYSSEPSKLTLDIVSRDGTYSTPTLNSSERVSFAGFVFNGYVWSYEIKETAEEKVLQVVLVDESIILDRYSVVLWKRGLFGKYGTKFIQNKEFDFSNESTFVLVDKDTYIKIEKRRLGKEVITRPRRYFNGRIGNIICVGTEKYPSSVCDIPDTDYSLNELKQVISRIVSGVTFNTPSEYRNTHEGTLREVLQNWAADAGVEFYWDFAQNKIMTYPTQNGISINTSFNSPNLIEKSSSSSLEGTWVQCAYAYTTKTRTPFDVGDASQSITYFRRIHALPISWYLRRNGTIQSIGIVTDVESSDDETAAREKNLWGGRLQDEFLIAAFLGYVSPTLRDIYVSLPPTTTGPEEIPEPIPWWALGITRTKTSNDSTSIYLTAQEKELVITNLQLKAKDSYDELNKIDPGLSNFNLFFGILNDGINEKWKQTEQEILASYGANYRHNLLNGAYFYCESNFVIQSDVSVSPNSTKYEGDNEDFKGLRIMSRGGEFSHSQNKAQELLGLDQDEINEKIEKIKIRSFDLESSGLKKLFPETQGTHLFITPTLKLVKQYLDGFTMRIGRGPNPAEATITKILSSRTEDSSGTDANCDKFDNTVLASQCPDAKTEAYEKATKKITPPEGNTGGIDGLVSSAAAYAEIKIGNKSLEIHAPADGPYQVVCTVNTSIKFIKDSDNFEKIFFNSDGDSSKANRVARLDVIKDNVTDPLEDDFGTKRKNPIVTAKAVSNTSPSRRSRYVFAGEPPRGMSLKPSNGLTSIDISYSSDGFKTTVEFTSKPPKRTTVDTFRRQIESQFNRSAFNAT
jgi:hypothetical protein